MRNALLEIMRAAYDSIPTGVCLVGYRKQDFAAHRNPISIEERMKLPIAI